jgi:hypothetical protein
MNLLQNIYLFLFIGMASAFALTKSPSIHTFSQQEERIYDLIKIMKNVLENQRIRNVETKLYYNFANLDYTLKYSDMGNY